MIEPSAETVADSSARTITPETSVSEAAALLRDPDVPALVVLDEETVVGVVTESDLVAMVAETDDHPEVGAIMSAPVTTIPAGTTVREAADRMRSAGVKHLPLVDDGVYLGLVSAADLAPYCSRHRTDVEWADEPMTLDSTESAGMTAGD